MSVYRIGAWCAVSSRPQADADRESLPYQESRAREFAAAVGGEVVRVYSVPGHTRDYWSWHEIECDVPAYAEIRSDLEAGKLDVVFCLDSDRLGRDPALIQQFYSLAERHGCEIYDASMPHQLGQATIGHRYGVAVKSVAAGEDQRRRVQRHLFGMRGRVKRGLLPATPPFWLDPIRDDMSGEVIGYEFNDRLPALDLMTRLFLDGHSYQQIVHRMNASGYPAPEGSRWWVGEVCRTLAGSTAAGIARWGSAQTAEPSARFPARWDADTFRAVQAELRRRQVAGYVHRNAGPLTHVAICARCGGPMSRAWKASGYRLRCGRHPQRHLRPGYACHPNYIRESVALAELTTFLDYLTTSEVIDAALGQMETGTDEAALRAEIEQASGQGRELETRRQRLAHALAAGQMDAGMYRMTDDDLLRQVAAQEERRARAELALAAIPNREDRRARLEALSADWPALLAAADPVRTSTLLQAAGIRVYCESGQVVRIELG